jgi:predicted site-specific integrase-resolvase
MINLTTDEINLLLDSLSVHESVYAKLVSSTGSLAGLARVSATNDQKTEIDNQVDAIKRDWRTVTNRMALLKAKLITEQDAITASEEAAAALGGAKEETDV